MPNKPKYQAHNFDTITSSERPIACSPKKSQSKLENTQTFMPKQSFTESANGEKFYIANKVENHKYQMNAHKICINIIQEKDDLSVANKVVSKQDMQVVCNTPIFETRISPKLTKNRSMQNMHSKQFAFNLSRSQGQEILNNFLIDT